MKSLQKNIQNLLETIIKKIKSLDYLTSEYTPASYEKMQKQIFHSLGFLEENIDYFSYVAKKIAIAEPKDDTKWSKAEISHAVYCALEVIRNCNTVEKSVSWTKFYNIVEDSKLRHLELEDLGVELDEIKLPKKTKERPHLVLMLPQLTLERLLAYHEKYAGETTCNDEIIHKVILNIDQKYDYINQKRNEDIYFFAWDGKLMPDEEHTNKSYEDVKFSLLNFLTLPEALMGHIGRRKKDFFDTSDIDIHGALFLHTIYPGNLENSTHRKFARIYKAKTYDHHFHTRIGYASQSDKSSNYGFKEILL